MDAILGFCQFSRLFELMYLADKKGKLTCDRCAGA